MKSWVTSVVVITLISYFLKIMMPTGKMKKIIALIMSALTMLVIASPLKNIENSFDQFLPQFETNNEYEQYFDTCRKEFYFNQAKIKLKANNIELIKAEFIFDNAQSSKKLKKIEISLSDLVIIDENQHIDIMSVTKKTLSELFCLSEDKIFIIKRGKIIE